MVPARSIASQMSGVDPESRVESGTAPSGKRALSCCVHGRTSSTHWMLVAFSQLRRSEVSPDIAKCLLGDPASQLGVARVRQERRDSSGTQPQATGRVS